MNTPTEPTDRDGARAFLLGLVIIGWETLIPLRFTNPDMTDVRFFLIYWPLYTSLALATALYLWLRLR